MIHTHVAARAYGDARRRSLTRRCPVCGVEQLTPEASLNDPVSCERCEAAIPPKGAEGRAQGKKKRASAGAVRAKGGGRS